jgi:hypothetical protein
MTQTRLIGFEAAALRGADLLSDDELAGKLADLVDVVATGDDDHERIQDLRELAAVCLVAARRLGAYADTVRPRPHPTSQNRNTPR